MTILWPEIYVTVTAITLLGNSLVKNRHCISLAQSSQVLSHSFPVFQVPTLMLNSSIAAITVIPSPKWRLTVGHALCLVLSTPRVTIAWLPSTLMQAVLCQSGVTDRRTPATARMVHPSFLCKRIARRFPETAPDSIQPPTFFGIDQCIIVQAAMIRTHLCRLLH